MPRRSATSAAARSAATALAVAPRSSSSPAGIVRRRPTSRSRPPAGDRPHERDHGAAALDEPDVAVVAEADDRRPDRRVDRAVGAPRRGQGLAQQVGEHRGDQHGAVRARHQPPDLRVVAEPAGRLLDLREQPAGADDGLVEGARVGHDEPGVGAPQLPVVGGDHVRTRSRWRGWCPPCPARAWCRCCSRLVDVLPRGPRPGRPRAARRRGRRGRVGGDRARRGGDAERGGGGAGDERPAPAPVAAVPAEVVGGGAGCSCPRR